MEEILNQLQDKLVQNRNTLRYSLAYMVEKAIKGSVKVDTCLFLRALGFNVGVYESEEIHTRIHKGESFMDIMNDITNKKLDKKS